MGVDAVDDTINDNLGHGQQTSITTIDTRCPTCRRISNQEGVKFEEKPEVLNGERSESKAVPGGKEGPIGVLKPIEERDYYVPVMNNGETIGERIKLVENPLFDSNATKGAERMEDPQGAGRDNKAPNPKLGMEAPHEKQGKVSNLKSPLVTSPAGKTSKMNSRRDHACENASMAKTITDPPGRSVPVNSPKNIAGQAKPNAAQKMQFGLDKGKGAAQSKIPPQNQWNMNKLASNLFQGDTRESSGLEKGEIKNVKEEDQGVDFEKKREKGKQVEEQNNGGGYKQEIKTKEEGVGRGSYYGVLKTNVDGDGDMSSSTEEGEVNESDEEFNASYEKSEEEEDDIRVTEEDRWADDGMDAGHSLRLLQHAFLFSFAYYCCFSGAKVGSARNAKALADLSWE
nr:hypothetical protein Iba_chr15aCG15070 [Ipomoea batatas]